MHRHNSCSKKFFARALISARFDALKVRERARSNHFRAQHRLIARSSKRVRTRASAHHRASPCTSFASFARCHLAKRERSRNDTICSRCARSLNTMRDDLARAARSTRQQQRARHTFARSRSARLHLPSCNSSGIIGEQIHRALHRNENAVSTMQREVRARRVIRFDQPDSRGRAGSK